MGEGLDVVRVLPAAEAFSRPARIKSCVTWPPSYHEGMSRPSPRAVKILGDLDKDREVAAKVSGQALVWDGRSWRRVS